MTYPALDPERETVELPVTPADSPSAESPPSDVDALPSDGGNQLPPGRRSTQLKRWLRSPVLGGTLLFFAVCLGFLIHSPPLIGPDEPFHFDRVIAAAHGDLAVVPGALHRSAAARGAESAFAKTQMKRGAPSWAEFPATPRGERPSLADLGGDHRPAKDATNYLTQHPPLYYGVLGAVMWMMPNADGIPGDQLVFWLRSIGVIMMLPLPWLFHRSARVMLTMNGRLGPMAAAAVAAAPFAPALLPGLPRLASTLNNDNLCVLIGAAILYLCIRITRGDTSTRTAIIISLLAAAGSVTKLTVVAVVASIPIAYFIRWLIDRRLPKIPAVIILVVGAVVSSLWWIRNELNYGTLVPSELAWGSRYPLVAGVPRPPNKPFHPSDFWSAMGVQVPSRFWGSLGLHEPPQLPTQLLMLMSAVLLGAVITCAIVLRGRRLPIVLPWLLGIALMVAALANTYFHFRSYTALTGIQGRYAYPAALGLLLPIPIAVAWWLDKGRRWSALVVALWGLLCSGWALFLSVEYTWLHRGEHLSFANVGRAFAVFSRHFAFSPGFAIVGIVLVTLAAVGGIVIAVMLALGEPDVTGDEPLTVLETTSAPAKSDQLLTA